MPTAAFEAAWNARSVGSAAVLLQLVLTAGGGGVVTLCLATRDVTTPAGATGRPVTFWHAAIMDPGTIRAPGSYLTSDYGLCSNTVVLALDAPVAGSKPLADYLAGYIWAGAEARLWLWESSLSDFDDADPQLIALVQSVDVEGARLTLSLLQKPGWNCPVNAVTAQREQYPNLQDASVGAAIPRVWGRVQGPPCRAPRFSEDYPLINLIERIRGAKRVAPALLVEPGRGDAKAVVALAAHPCYAAGSQGFATSAFMVIGDALCPLVNCTVVNDDTGTRLLIPDMTAVARVSAVPNRLLSASPGIPENFSALFDPWNEQSFTRYRWAAVLSQRVGFGPVPSDLGNVSHVRAHVIYRTSANYGGDGASMYFTYLPDESGYGFNVTLSTAWTTATLDLTSWLGPKQDIDLRLTENLAFDVANNIGPNGWTGYIDVLAVGIELEFTPQQTKLDVVRKVVQKTRPTHRGWLGGFDTSAFLPQDPLPLEQEVRSGFYTHLIGITDPDGFHTGTFGAVVERPCDIVSHALVTLAGVPKADIEHGTGALGSFVDARTLLRTAFGTDMVLAVQVADDTDMGTLLARIGQSSLSWVTVSPRTGRFHFIPWLRNPAATRAAIHADRFVTHPIVTVTPNSALATAVRVSYGYDAKQGSYLHEASVSPGASNAGHKYFNLADQDLRIILGANDKLDVSNGSTTRTATLPTVSRTFNEVYELTDTLRTALEGIGTFTGETSPVRLWLAGVGGYVGYRTIMLSFNDGYGHYDVGLDGAAQALYGRVGQFTMQEYAAIVAHAMNTCGNPDSSFTCTYNPATKKFTIARPSRDFQLRFGAQANNYGGFQGHSCGACLGFTPVDGHAGLTSYTGDFAVEWARFIITSNRTFSLLWRTGTNGALRSDGRPLSCYSALGFSLYDDTPLAYGAFGDVPKGNLQYRLGVAADRYLNRLVQGSARRPKLIEARDVNDTDTALAVRDGVAILGSSPHIKVRGLLEGVVGLERGDVIPELVGMPNPYPDPDGDGSWSGKKFYVVETEQHLGPDNLATDVVLVSV